MINGGNLSDTEKKIISLLVREHSLSKKQIAESVGISWGSAVKFITLLENKKIIKIDGTLLRDDNKGKNAYTYSFNELFPLSIGVDVEYRTTHITLTNLRTEVLAEQWYETVPLDELDRLETFLENSIGTFLDSIENKEALIGIGISLPGIGDPVFAVPDDYTNRDNVTRRLEQRFGVPIRMEMNIKAFTMFENLHGTGQVDENFLAVTIRTGVGGGIVLGGKLYTGLYNIAGSIGHFTVVPGGIECCCGKSGCLETLVSKERLKQKYADVNCKDISQVSIRDLFRDADAGIAESEAIVADAAHYIGEAVGHALLVLNISRVLVTTYFEGNYRFFHEELEKTINKTILPSQRVELVTADLDPKAFSLGAALLVFQQLLA